MDKEMFMFYVEQQRLQFEDLKADIKALEIKVEGLQNFKSKVVGMAALIIFVSELFIRGIEHLK